MNDYHYDYPITGYSVYGYSYTKGRGKFINFRVELALSGIPFFVATNDIHSPDEGYYES